MNDVRSYVAPLQPGEVMRGSTVGIVVKSTNSKFPEGTKVSGGGLWQEYCVTDGKGWIKIE